LVFLQQVSAKSVQWVMTTNAASTPTGYDGQFFNVYTDGNAAVFDQSIESYMEVSYTPDLNAAKFSIAVWVLTSQDPNSGLNSIRTILTSRNYAILNNTGLATGYSISLNTNNQYVGTVGCSTLGSSVFFNVIGATACTDDGCYDHLVWQCDATTTCELWVNKQKYIVSDTPGTLAAYKPQTTNPLRIGASTGTASGCAGGGSPSYCNGFTGVIKNVRYFDKWLLDTDVSSAVDKGPDEIPALSTGAIVGVFFVAMISVLMLGGCGAMFLQKWKKQLIEGTHVKLDD